jgi:fumarate reductase subunit D
MAQGRSIEPLLWLLFSAGGVLAAFFLPVLVLVFGVAVPMGWCSPPAHAHMLAVLGNPLTRIVLFFLCFLGFFHWAHRFRFTLFDGLQIKHLNEVITVVCYGGAILGSIAAGWVLGSV